MLREPTRSAYTKIYMSKLSFLVYSKNPETRAVVADQLLATDRVVVTATFTDLPALVDALRRRRIDGIYLDLNEDPQATLDAAAALPEPRPTILVGSDIEDTQLLLQAMRAGARDFFIGHRLVCSPASYPPSLLRIKVGSGVSCARSTPRAPRLPPV